MKHTIVETLEIATKKVIDFDESEGIANGHNGPYHDDETPVRNTSHWLIVFCALYTRTGKEIYEEAANKAIRYLKSKDARPMTNTFFCRKKREKDFCNGVMGQAWVIEALLYASKTFSRSDLYDLAEEVFLLHPFDNKRCIWNRVSVDGSILPFDTTFNHQLWFASIGASLYRTPVALDNSKRFFNKVAKNVSLYSDGVICHGSIIKSFNTESKLGLNSILDYLINKLYFIKNKKSLYSKSIGYHGFNLYAFTVYKKAFPDEPFFKSSKYQKMLTVTLTDGFNDALATSKYGYPYNPPGFEISFALIEMGFSFDEVMPLLIQHFKITKSVSTNVFNSAVSEDVKTSEARLYELVRLLEYDDFNKNEIKF